MPDITISPADFHPCLALRIAVFVEEQGIPMTEEIDTHDDGATHLLARVDGVAAGTARLLVEGETGRIGRICVLPAYRGTGLGAALVRDGIARLAGLGLRDVVLGAQVQAMEFYERLGFHAEGAVYDDAGIPHRTMRRIL